jgi:hypothetical protein
LQVPINSVLYYNFSEAIDKKVSRGNISAKIKSINPFGLVSTGNISAKIKSINPYGVIIIRFSEILETKIFINNASLILNETNMNIRLKPLQNSEGIIN